MSHPHALVDHYSSKDLLGRISQALEAERITPPYDPDVLSAVDEFHIGGRVATQSLIAQMRLTPSSRCLDVGCGLGGPARAVAKITGAHVTGLDLSQDFVTTGRALTGLCVLLDRVNLMPGDALAMPFETPTFDAAYMMHVGMNIADKAALMAQVAQALKPGARFAIYDVMRVGAGDLAYPMPWASAPDHSWLASPPDYVHALEQAGFTVTTRNDRTSFAARALAAQAAARADGPPPLGLHLVMGADTATKFDNLRAGVEAGLIAPFEIIAERR